MKYLMLICAEPGVVVAPEDASPGAWIEEMTERKIRLEGNRLRPVEQARTIRMRDGEILATDGPYAETKDQIGGYDIIECADLDEAIEVAAKHPVAKWGTIEVRPIWEM